MWEMQLKGIYLSQTPVNTFILRSSRGASVCRQTEFGICALPIMCYLFHIVMFSSNRWLYGNQNLQNKILDRTFKLVMQLISIFTIVLTAESKQRFAYIAFDSVYKQMKWEHKRPIYMMGWGQPHFKQLFKQVLFLVVCGAFYFLFFLQASAHQWWDIHFYSNHLHYLRQDGALPQHQILWLLSVRLPVLVQSSCVKYN